MAETAAGRVDFMAGVEQVIPFPGKLREQGQIAGREAAVALADLEALRLAFDVGSNAVLRDRPQKLVDLIV